MYAIPLKEAWICVNCENIFSWRDKVNGEKCPVCGSKVIYSLTKWLNRKEEENGLQGMSNKEN